MRALSSNSVAVLARRSPQSKWECHFSVPHFLQYPGLSGGRRNDEGGQSKKQKKKFRIKAAKFLHWLKSGLSLIHLPEAELKKSVFHRWKFWNKRMYLGQEALAEEALSSPQTWTEGFSSDPPCWVTATYYSKISSPPPHSLALVNESCEASFYWEHPLLLKNSFPKRRILRRPESNLDCIQKLKPERTFRFDILK